MTEETFDKVDVATGITVYAEFPTSGGRVPITRKEDGYHYGNGARLVVDNSSDHTIEVSSQYFDSSGGTETLKGQVRKGTAKTFSTASKVEIAGAAFVNDTPMRPALPKTFDQRADEFAAALENSRNQRVSGRE